MESYGKEYKDGHRNSLNEYEVRCNSRKGNCVECVEQFICEEPCEEKQKQNNNTLTLAEKWKKQKCDTCYHDKTEFSVCQYCTDVDKYEEVE